MNRWSLLSVLLPSYVAKIKRQASHLRAFSGSALSRSSSPAILMECASPIVTWIGRMRGFPLDPLVIITESIVARFETVGYKYLLKYPGFISEDIGIHGCQSILLSSRNSSEETDVAVFGMLTS